MVWTEPISAQPGKSDFSDQTYFWPYLQLERIHLSLVGLVIVAVGVQDAVKEEIADLGRQAVMVFPGLFLRLRNRNNQITEARSLARKCQRVSGGKG